MYLIEKLRFDEVRITGVHLYSADDNPSCVLELSAKLTRPIAESLGFHGMAYNESGVPNTWDGSIKLGRQMKEVELIFAGNGSGWTTKPSIVRGFAVSHAKTKSDTDITLMLAIRAHLPWKDHEKAAGALAKLNKEAFGMQVEPLQGALFEAAGE